MADTLKLSSGDPLVIAAPVEWRGACLSLPALRALKGLVSELRVLCREEQASFWQSCEIGKVITYPDGANARAISGLLSAEGASLAWEPGSAADAFAKIGIPHRYGPPAKGLVKRLSQTVEVIERPGPVQHRVRFYLNIAAKFGAETMVPENFEPVRLGVPRASDRVILVPDSDYGAHYEWPLDRWVTVAKEVVRRINRVGIASCGPIGTALAKAVPEATEVPMKLPGLDDLGSSAICITADGSVPHLAAHVGTTCIVLYGPGDPEWSRPLGRQHVLIRRKVECAPCHAPSCRMDLRCQQDLEVDEVLKSLEGVI